MNISGRHCYSFNQSEYELSLRSRLVDKIWSNLHIARRTLMCRFTYFEKKIGSTNLDGRQDSQQIAE
jgi:hypothetical protein